MYHMRMESLSGEMTTNKGLEPGKWSVTGISSAAASLCVSTLPSACSILTFSPNIYLEWESERVSFTPPKPALPSMAVNPCQSAVNLNPAVSSETKLISHFTQIHPGVIDFSFSEWEMDSLSFITERRRSWQTVARNLMEASVKCNLFQDPSVISFTLNWIIAFCLWAYQRLSTADRNRCVLFCSEFASKCKWAQSVLQ